MSRPATAPARRPAAPRNPRRVSGPAARPPARVPRAAPAPRPTPEAREQQRTTGALRAVSDHRFLDSLLRSRAWIWIVGIGLGGIVAMQVSLLKLNTGISRAVESAATLERQNAELEVQVARLSSDERIGAAARKVGMVRQDASHVVFLTSRGERDAVRAAARMTPPSAAAQALMANGGFVAPGTLAAATTTAPAAGTIPTPEAAATTPVAAAAAPAGTAAPAATAAPTSPTTPAAAATTP
jgi:cell division protein FtsL